MFCKHLHQLVQIVQGEARAVRLAKIEHDFRFGRRLGPQGDQVLATLPLTDGSVATSGQYENFLMIDGVPHGHILDPRSGLPVPGGLSITVLADRAMIADALATAAVVLGPESGLRLLESQPGVEGILFVRGEDGKTRILTTTGLVDSP